MPRTVSPSARVTLWVCLAAWSISFILPAAKLDPHGAALPGWEIAWDALALLVVPVKGAWLGFLPGVWTVFLNLFMLAIPLESKAIEQGRGRVFAVLFSIGSIVPVVLAYIPSLLGLAMPLLVGFYLWEASMIVAAALFVRRLWSGTWSGMPTALAILLLVCLPIRRGELSFAPESPKSTATSKPAIPSTQAIPVSESVQPTTIVVDSSPNPALRGELVTFSVRVSVPWGKRPSGNVILTDLPANKVIGRARTGDGTAMISTSELSTGQHSIRATFVADATDLLGSEESFVQIVDEPRSGKLIKPGD